MSKYIVLDIVFYASSLNYDQGSGSYQELKKITKWDGKQYALVSRYALRYSVLYWANKLFNDWKLAGKNELNEDKKVVQIKRDKIVEAFKECPEFDLFGFMSTGKKKGKKSKTNQENNNESDGRSGEDGNLIRVSPVKISHAISLTPFNFDSHFSANLGVMKRAGGIGSNPINIEEKKDFYIYNVTIDLDRIGKFLEDEHRNTIVGDIIIDDKEKGKRIRQLIESIFSLKREIKGRMEDLSPWIAIVGLYENEKYDLYSDRMELSKSSSYKIITKRKEIEDKDGRKVEEVENETIEKQSPKFVIDIDSLSEPITKEDLINKIEKFVNGEKSEEKMPLVFKKNFVEVKPSVTQNN